MIYTITLNPSLDYHVEVDNFESGILNRTKSDYKVPGGKGINVSRVLKRLGAESIALGFIGGFTGAYIKDFLSEEQIALDFVEVDEDTRINIKLRSVEETEINGAGPAITPQQLEQLFSKFQSIKPNDMVIFSGSIPVSLPSSIYADLIKICKHIGACFVADVSGQALKQVILEKPFLIKPNHHELGELFQTKIESVQDAYIYGKKLVDEGVENIIISMAEKGALFINKNLAIHATAPKGELKNSIGAGDSLVGGFLSAYSSGKSLEEAFKIGVASGSATAFSQGLCTKDKVMNLLNEVKIKTLK
ncbi:1-phosphofructokinase [Bacillus sp. FJAT-49736]|uniref:1-phosphofructokinase n=1 Tax=Bacillus sp. FJAT-49736 TaxID=2833582 RepID=UPI001BC9E3E8|nr:1-phosphofructokinase [Bacillus sp. FJAT-49736]MBS4172270.1 1-phosphofructokinase [Bacillus sp. FJAT-49736]